MIHLPCCSSVSPNLIKNRRIPSVPWPPSRNGSFGIMRRGPFHRIGRAVLPKLRWLLFILPPLIAESRWFLGHQPSSRRFCLQDPFLQGGQQLGRLAPNEYKRSKSLSLNKLWGLNPPLKKGEIGGFALRSLGEIPPAPLLQRGECYLRTSSKYCYSHCEPRGRRGTMHRAPTSFYAERPGR